MPKEKEEVKEIQTAGEVKLVATNDGKRNDYAIFEQIDSHFLYYEQGTGFQETRISITNAQAVYRPMQIYPFPALEDPVDYGSIEELFRELRSFIYDHVDFTEPLCYDIVAAFTIASWRAENFECAPYLLFLGDFGSGKTRALEVLQELCYRALVSASISTAALVRLLEKYRVTVLVDETELLNSKSKYSDSRQELVAILNSGYKRGQFYTRAKPDTDDVEFRKTFGFKALAGTQDFVQTLNSRCIPIAMERTTRRVRRTIDRDRALELRRKLLDYRFKRLMTELPSIDLPFKNARNYELFTALVQVAPEEARKSIVEYGKKLEDERQIDDATSFEADILQAIIALDRARVKAADILTFLSINQVITLDLEKAKASDIQSYKSRISRIIKNKFHFRQNTKKEFYIDKAALERLKSRYLASEISDISDTSDTAKPIQNIGNIGNNQNTGQGAPSNTNDCSDSAECTDLQTHSISMLVDIARMLGSFTTDEFISECSKASIEVTEEQVRKFLQGMNNHQGRIFAEALDRWRWQG